MLLTRRSFFCALAAPAIVRVASIVPVRALDPELLHGVAPDQISLYAELSAITRKTFLPRLFLQARLQELNS